MSHLDILIPFALPPPEMAPDLVRALKTSTFATLLSQAKVTTSPSLDEFSRSLPHESWLAERFGLGALLREFGSPPVAVAMMRACGLNPDDGTWFMLQPIHIHVARDHLVLTDLRQLALTESDSKALFAIANPFFDEVGRQLVYGDARHWFVRADDWRTLQTATPDATCGHNIDIWMPKDTSGGTAALIWRKLQNEIQMAWHDHALNDAREGTGLKPVNSIWLWGGTPTAMKAPSTDYQQLFNATDWTRALGKSASIERGETSLSSIVATSPSHGLTVIDTLIEPGLAGDWAEWIDRIHVLESEWFAPILDAFKVGKLDRLSLVLSNSVGLTSFTLTRQSLRKFWVKPSLSRLLS